MAEIDGNVGCWMAEGETQAELSRTAKFRGPMFEPLTFDIKVVELPALTDSKGRRMTAAIAVPSDEDGLQADAAAAARRRILLGDVSLHPKSSLRERAERTDIAKNTVDRDLHYLMSKRAITEALNGHDLTPKGKQWLAET